MGIGSPLDGWICYMHIVQYSLFYPENLRTLGEESVEQTDHQRLDTLHLEDLDLEHLERECIEQTDTISKVCKGLGEHLDGCIIEQTDRNTLHLEDLDLENTWRGSVEQTWRWGVCIEQTDDQHLDTLHLENTWRTWRGSVLQSRLGDGCIIEDSWRGGVCMEQTDDQHFRHFLFPLFALRPLSCLPSFLHTRYLQTQCNTHTQTHIRIVIHIHRHIHGVSQIHCVSCVLTSHFPVFTDKHTIPTPRSRICDSYCCCL